ncbi:cytochrome b [Paralimibaculum aggregatum]|uniref:Cytochrome b n=1 Tax=Paralimibaculum aggregatum TaxID=3036245 RepID=A0ABQ6LKQ9_9RHOB|nr:cytochrome b [Limibaculum sp. NKW23]GMG82839.1 cytochrome b [Limibaculum sp. NKW23]
MGLSNTREGWGWPARLLHWLMALLILGMLGVGFYMVEIVGDDLIQRFNLTQMHKSWGVIVFALALLRILWRAVTPSPAPVPMPAWQKTAAQASHLALYALMIALPLTGWLMASSSPYNDADAYVQIRNEVRLTYLFGAETLAALGLEDALVWAMPDPYEPGDEALSKRFEQVHLALALALTAVLGLHVAAALKHQFIDRDGLLMRMIRGH